ncbi:MAG: sigma factor G inhibitor Gin [Alicyclobacillus sp.]|nr:sigma factor G inhibitor Gin [Alicyclobacillus sp.]
MEAQQPVCIVCQQPKTAGIHICGQFLCSDCEQAIVTTDVSDARYRYYVDCMKRIWLNASSS